VKAVAGLMLATALAGCAGPRPLVPAGAAFTTPVAWSGDPSGPAGPVDASWWRGFGDPQLSAVVDRALANNVDLAIAATRIEEARAQFRLAQAQRLPNVTGAISGARERDVDPFLVGLDQTDGEAQLSISYDLDLFGRLRNASAAARASLLATTYARDNIRLAIAASAAGAYVNLRSLDARMLVLGDALATRKGSLDLARRRFGAGYDGALDLRQAEAEYRSAEQLIPQTELAIARQEHGLSLLLGENPGMIARGTSLAAIALPKAATSLPADVLRRRPDIAQAEAQLVAADRSLDSARAAFMPGIQLVGSGGYVASTLLTQPIGVFALSGSVLAPIFDSGRLKAQEKGAAARRDQAAFAYRKTALIAFREVEDSLSAVRLTDAQERVLAEQRTALASALAIATNRYKEGYSPYLEQLDAQRSLLSADLALVQSRADRLQAAIKLYQALGGGWQPQA